MTTKTDGGHAFPTQSWEYDGQNQVLQYQEPGMSLRDAMALSVRIPDEYSVKWAEVLIGEQQPHASEPVGVQIDWWMRVEAAYRYRMADAMLAYRMASDPPTIRALLAERDALREALEMMVEMVEMNGFGRDYAMDVARAGDAPPIPHGVGHAQSKGGNMNIEQERAAFEAWCETLYRDTGRDDEGDYIAIETDISWEAWQARAALQLRDKEDAERYRFLSSMATQQADHLGPIFRIDVRRTPQTLFNFDAAVDHARRIESEKSK